MTMKKIGRKGAKLIREELEEILTEPLRNLGLRFELGSGGYDDDSVKFNGFRISTLDALTKEQKDLKHELKDRESIDWMLSLDAERIVQEGSRSYKLHGYRNRARKNPFIIIDTKTQSEYLISENEAERLFGIKGSDSGTSLNYTPKVIG